MIRIVEYSVLLLESDAFQKNSWWSVEIVSLLWEQGRGSQFYPPTKKKQPAPLPLPCSALQWLQTALGFFPVLLWTDCSYFRWKLDCVTSCTPSSMGRFFFFTFVFFHICKNELFRWGACVHLGFVCLWVEPSGCGIFHGNCFSCWLKDFL